jgi:hypothetical protein
MNDLRRLRALLPNRRLTRTEAFGLAERQATLLLKLNGITDGPVPSDVIARQPFLRVAVRSPMMSSGASRWIKPRWVVLLNGLEPAARQRFSLAHEFKHILDHHYMKQYGDRAPTATEHLATEQLCDYFAGCVWMPRLMVKRAFGKGVQDVVALAHYFKVSPSAMYVRLVQLGLIDPFARHSEIDNGYLRSSSLSPLELAA